MSKRGRKVYVQSLHRCWSSVKGLLFCSQFGDQLIADLRELFNLLILRGTKRWWWQMTNTNSSTFRHPPTFWRTALSRDSTFICSFLRPALSATASVLALARTCAISSLALFERDMIFKSRAAMLEGSEVTNLEKKRYLFSFSSACTLSVWYRCSSCLIRIR